MNSSISKKYKKIDFFIIALFLVSLLVVGGTYAYISTSLTISNGNYNTKTTCLNVTYNITNDDGSLPITGPLFPSTGPSGGIFGKVSLKINDSCSITGLGTLTLNVTTGSDILFQTASGHCENSQTLETIPSYTDSSSCNAQTNYKWVTNGTALKYAIYNTSSISDAIPLNVGYLNSTSSIDIYKDISVTAIQSNFYVYIWLDGYVSDNSYANIAFDGNISASVEQVDS